MRNRTPELTALLSRWRRGDEQAASVILREVYRDLRKVAGGYMRRERADHTLQPTALLNEAWIRMANCKEPPVANREQFFRAMAAYMRRQLVDHARRDKADKRGAGVPEVALDGTEFDVASPAASDDTEQQLQSLEAALAHLREQHPRAAEVVELRFFANQTVDEVARALCVSPGTVKRDFDFARAFLLAELVK